MKKTSIVAILFLFAGMGLPGGPLEDLELGKIHFPRDYIHNQQVYSAGNYQVDLDQRDQMYYFVVSDMEGSILFEELAVIKPYTGKAKNFKYRIKKEFLKDYEYFRIKITTPENLIMGYFLVAGKEPTETPEN